MENLDVTIKKMVIAVLVLLGLFLLVESVVAIKKLDRSQLMPPSVITVRGTGEAVGRPDVATFTFTVREKGRTVVEAQQAMSDKSNKAMEYLKEQGIEDRDIKTESYYTNPVYEYVQGAPVNSIYPVPGRSIITGYEAAQTVSIKVRDIEKSGSILTGISNLKVSEVSGISFTIDDIDSLKIEAKKQAIEKAKAEAKAIADSLGVKLDDITGFYEEYPYDRPYGGETMSAQVQAKDLSVVPDLAEGEQKVTAIVSITYEID